MSLLPKSSEEENSSRGFMTQQKRTTFHLQHTNHRCVVLFTVGTSHEQNISFCSSKNTEKAQSRGLKSDRRVRFSALPPRAVSFPDRLNLHELVHAEIV